MKVWASVAFAYPDIITRKLPFYQDRTIPTNYNSRIRSHSLAEQLREKIRQFDYIRRIVVREG
jgi:hypothetical protein